LTQKRVAWNKGIPMTEEAKAHLSEVNKGRKLTEEAKRRIGEASKGNQHNIGRTPHNKGYFVQIIWEHEFKDEIAALRKKGA
jgi:hypothetical protein